eukprot:7793646-Pyramimonas_sp.AAC.1
MRSPPWSLLATTVRERALVSEATRKSLAGGKRWWRRSGRKMPGRSWGGARSSGALIGCPLE